MAFRLSRETSIITEKSSKLNEFNLRNKYVIFQEVAVIKSNNQIIKSNNQTIPTPKKVNNDKITLNIELRVEDFLLVKILHLKSLLYGLS